MKAKIDLVKTKITLKKGLVKAEMVLWKLLGPEERPESKNGLVKTEKPSEAKHGLVKAKNGFMKATSGLMKATNGCECHKWI